MTCSLCELVSGKGIITKWYYSNHLVLVVDCIGCKTIDPSKDHPMIVLRRHTLKPTQEEERQMENICHILFPDKQIRKTPKQILDHAHWHILV